MEITKERLGFGPFGSELDSEEVRIPVHPVFDPSRKALGRGLLGLALAHREAREAEGGSFEARLGTVVPFPDVVSSDAVHGLFGGAWDGLDSSSPSPSEYELPEDHLVGFKYFLKERFADPGLDDAVLRLFEMSTRMRGRREAYPQSLQPPERWDFRREDERSEESREERVEAARRQKAEWEAQEELSSEEEAKGPDIDLGGEE